ncbi:MAG: aldehyde dehydrogenase (NADP(+)), partial [Actinobacteria bacterium]|nr:aldehyde dehydrogenase (NADP(+)) [Actinomycetota bacterium]
ALLGSGQFCTKPGIIIIPNDSLGNKFIEQVKTYISQQKVAPLLNKAIADRFREAIKKLSISKSLEVISGISNLDGYGVTPNIFIANWSEVSQHNDLLEEHFGPTSVIIRAPFDQYLTVAKELAGQLTATIHAGKNEDLSELINQLSQIAGRVIWNGFPTAVSVTAAQNHGGQWPASSTHTTSVGIDAIYRFVRPVVYQNFPDHQLPPELQNSNPFKIERVVNSVRTDQPIQ